MSNEMRKRAHPGRRRRRSLMALAGMKATICSGLPHKVIRNSPFLQRGTGAEKRPLCAGGLTWRSSPVCWIPHSSRDPQRLKNAGFAAQESAGLSDPIRWISFESRKTISFLYFSSLPSFDETNCERIAWNRKRRGFRIPNSPRRTTTMPNSIVYAIEPDGDLMWARHVGS